MQVRCATRRGEFDRVARAARCAPGERAEPVHSEVWCGGGARADRRTECKRQQRQQRQQETHQTTTEISDRVHHKCKHSSAWYVRVRK